MIDNYGLWERHEAEQQRQLEKCPKCDYCGDYIQDEHLYDIDGTIICEECMERNFKKETENYMK
jgi:formylmethanofuran dehydrogenase subunit E